MISGFPFLALHKIKSCKAFFLPMENLVQRLRWVTLVPCFYFELHSSNYKKSYHLQPQKQLSGKINCKTSSFSRLWQKQVHYDKKLLKQFPEIITSRRFSFIWQLVTLVMFPVVVLLKACKLSYHFCCWTNMLGTVRWSLRVLFSCYIAWSTLPSWNMVPRITLITIFFTYFSKVPSISWDFLVSFLLNSSAALLLVGARHQKSNSVFSYHPSVCQLS